MLAGMVKWLMRPKDLGAPHHAALIGVARLLHILRQLVSGYFGSGDRVGRLASFTILRANEARACPLGLLSASSLLTPAAIRPNERRESALRAAANAVSPATVTRCLAQGVQRCLQPVVGFVIAERSIIRHACIGPFRLFQARGRRIASGLEAPVHSTAPFACECQFFLDNLIAGLGVCSFRPCRPRTDAPKRSCWRGEPVLRRVVRCLLVALRSAASSRPPRHWWARRGCGC